MFCRAVANVEEVSIGHALVSDALWMGFETAVKKYRAILDDVGT